MKRVNEKQIEVNPRIVELEKQLEECTHRWKRALADYQNLEKRIEEDKQDFIRFAAKNFITKLLGIVDDLEKAQAHLKDQGLDLALKKLTQILKDEGVERLEVLGKDYDIHSMEALTTVLGKEDNKVVEVFRTGYTMHGAVLRAAQVAVSKKSDK